MDKGSASPTSTVVTRRRPHWGAVRSQDFADDHALQTTGNHGHFLQLDSSPLAVRMSDTFCGSEAWASVRGSQVVSQSNDTFMTGDLGGSGANLAHVPLAFIPALMQP